MNPKFIHPNETGSPLIVPVPVVTASGRSLLLYASFNRALYGRVSTNSSGSADRTRASVSTHDPSSNRIETYLALPILKW